MTAALEWMPADGSLVIVPKRNGKRAICPKCEGTRDRPGQRYCKRCHNEYMREYRAAQLAELKHLRAFYAKDNLAHETSEVNT